MMMTNISNAPNPTRKALRSTYISDTAYQSAWKTKTKMRMTQHIQDLLPTEPEINDQMSQKDPPQ